MTGITPLIDGYRRFRTAGWARERERWTELADGQSPKQMIIACSDSRVDPATIFDTSPGETFVVRNVAALVPPFEIGGGYHGVSAALEFAVTQLEVTDIMVMGHGACGGCKASLTRAFAGAAPGGGGFIDAWIAMLSDARDAVIAEQGEGPDAETALEHRAVGVSLANLRTFPFVREREADGRLRLHGGWFGIAKGELLVRDEATGLFHPA
ncbi:MAG TPA: carbonic anhydrase [Sphingomonas sp.]|jgi:carbonic anhydrase|uniref:carbonic anhydrase n=1 Tax=Sphingomonas sp. TaxID=28214 RepID=UPI002ED9E282